MKGHRLDSHSDLHYLKAADKRAEAVQLVLNLNAEIDYLHKQGLGIGIIQQAEYTAENDAKVTRTIEMTERRYGIKGDQFRAENVKTPGRACMLALLHALGLAYSTIIKRGVEEEVQVAEITIRIPSPIVVQTVNHYVQNGTRSLEGVTKTNDRMMIRRVVVAVKRALRRGAKVAIVVANEHNMTRARARTLAKQKGSKPCRSRRQLQRAQSSVQTEELKSRKGRQMEKDG